VHAQLEGNLGWPNACFMLDMTNWAN